ncbi:MAG: serine O-acetyltransferase [Candidatus Omnitrophota bacterium]
MIGIVKVTLIRIFFAREIEAALERDPAASGALSVILTYPGLHALVYHRVSGLFHKAGLRFMAMYVSQIGRFFTGIEIHPGAQIGPGLFIDHGMGVVIGETTIIGENVTLFQGVTLGGTGKEKGKRHPTLGSGVVVGTGAKVLGNIKIGDNVSVGANAVVIRDVPSNSTVVGVPGRIANRHGKKIPGINLDHTSLPDPLTSALSNLQHEIDKIETQLKHFKDEPTGPK